MIQAVSRLYEATPAAFDSGENVEEAMAGDANQGKGDLSKADLMMGGPGLRGYAYQAAMWCVDCAHNIIDNMDQERFTHLEAGDTECVPVPAFFPESDMAEHCDGCSEYLYGGNDE